MKKFFSFLFSISLLMGLLTGCSGGGKRVIPEAPPCYVQLEKNGQSYEVYAAQGQVWLLFEPSVTPQQAEQILAQNNAKILDKEPEIGYYIVEVEAGTESAFVAKMKDYQEVNYAYPNALREANAVKPYLLDNFQGEHGWRVKEIFEESSSKSISPKDIALGVHKEIVSDYAIYQAISDVLLSIHSGSSAVITMPFGITIENFDWDREPDFLREKYQSAYVDALVGLVKYLRHHLATCGGEDHFVIVKSTGNDGVNCLEKFLDILHSSLSIDEWEFFENHFLLVTANDINKDWDYPNDVSNGGYHKMVSKVDISDKTSDNKDWCGTSYAAARLAGYMVKAADFYNLKATDILLHVREATKAAYGHMIDYGMLEEDIEKNFSPEENFWRGVAGHIYYNINNTRHMAEVTYDETSFRNYYGLEEVSFPSTVEYDADTYKVTRIGYLAFYECGSLKSVELPSSIRSIGSSAFEYCKNLEHINIPDNVRTIEYKAFKDCSSLKSIHIPNSVTSIGPDAFEYCSSLPIEDDLRYADTYLVEAVDKYKSNYTIKNGTRFIGNNAFGHCREVTSIRIPKGVTTIGNSAFQYCSKLRRVEIPSSVKNIEAQAFLGCHELTSITIPEGVKSINTEVFYGCRNLLSVTIPNTVTSIGYGAFWNCTSLTSIDIPNSVTSIEANAFYGCENLKRVYLPSNLEYLSFYAFEGCDNVKITYK